MLKRAKRKRNDKLFALLNGLWLLGLVVSPQRALARDSQEAIKDPSYWMQVCTLMPIAKPEEALAACERAVALRPWNPQMWANYGSLQVQLKQYQEAIPTLSQALKRSPKNAQALTDQCIAWIALGGDKQALDSCNRAIRSNWNWGRHSPAVAHHYRSILLNTSDGYETAIRAYEQQLAKTPNDSLALLYRCEALTQLGEYKIAIQSCFAALNGNKNWGTEQPSLAWALQGVAYNNLRQPEQAVLSFDQALRIDPKDAPLWMQQGELLRQLRRLEESLVAYNRAVELSPNSSQALVGQCTVLNQLQQGAAALAACQKSLQGDGAWGEGEPDEGHAWNQQAQALTLTGKFEEGLAAANRAVGMRPEWSDGWNTRAVVLWYLQRYPEAMASVQRSLELDPNNARAWANQGRIARSLNDPERSISAYQESLKRNGQDGSVWADLSAIQWAAGDYSSALESANQAVTVAPKLIQGWHNRALALIALQNFPEAQVSYQRAIDLDKTNADSWTGLGLVLSQLQDYPKALQALQTALSLNPQQVVAKQALQAVTQLLHQTPN